MALEETPLIRSTVKSVHSYCFSYENQKNNDAGIHWVSLVKLSLYIVNTCSIAEV